MRNEKGQFMKGSHPLKEFKKGQIPWNKGIEHSEETRKKISEALKGKPGPNLGKKLSNETKEKISKANKGRKQTEETKQKMSDNHADNSGKNHNNWKGGKPKCIDCGIEIDYRAKRCRKCSSGKNCHFWKGGISSENLLIRASIEYRLWRKSVFERDNFICQKCDDKKGGHLQAHHIQNFAQYPELRFAIDNGITFCKDCHTEFHKRYGIKNNNRKQLEEFLDI